MLMLEEVVEELVAYGQKSGEMRLPPIAIGYQPYAHIELCRRDAMRSIRGSDCFDNLGGDNYNEPISLGNELGFAKPYTQFLDYCPYRSRQINPR